MKNIITVALLCLIAFTSQGNAIDSIKTKKDVTDFLVKHVGAKYSRHQIFCPDSDRVWRENKGDFGNDSFYKADIDQNGLQDLYVDGSSAFIVLDSGGKYVVRYIDDNPFKRNLLFDSFLYQSGFPNRILLKNYILNVKQFRWDPDQDSVYKIDTVVFNTGGIVEYNSQYDQYSIDRITLSTTICFGSCSSFSIEILKNGLALYNAEQYNDSSGGFLGYIDKNKLEEITNLLAYLKINSLENSYAVPWTDDQQSFFQITFNGGKTKTISDYGMSGTLGLRNVYSIFRALRNSIEWKRWNNYTNNDSLLLSFSSSFRYSSLPRGGNVLQAVMTGINDSENDKEKVFRKYAIDVSGAYLTLYKDSSFVLIYCPGNKHDRNRLAIGVWSCENKKVILNWDGYKTLAACRSKKAWDFYSGVQSQPDPMRIENWIFTFSEDKATLEPYASEEK